MLLTRMSKSAAVPVPNRAGDELESIKPSRAFGRERSPFSQLKTPAMVASAIAASPGRMTGGSPRRGALDRVGWVLADWEADKQRLTETEDGMVAVLDDIELTALATSIHGISVVGAATIPAETCDPHRFTTARALVKHAGLAPRQRQSGTYTGRTRLTCKGRPRLRVAAWRAVWGALQTNTVYAARHRHLTTREHNKLSPPKPRP